MRGAAVEILDVRLFRVEADGPDREWESRSVRPLDAYERHLSSTEDAWIKERRLRKLYVEVVTEGGAGLYGPIDARQAFLIDTELRPLIVGLDGLATERVHDEMLRLQRHGRSGVFVTAISAIDNALWDLRGKVAGEPTFRLLGGPTRDVIPAYASMLGFPAEPDLAARAAAEKAGQGYTAQKWFFPCGPTDGLPGLRRNVALATAVREAVGDGYRLMFDAFMGWDAAYAIDMLRALEPIDPYWLEEPVPPERLGVFRRLAASSRIRLATGEHAHTRWQAKEILDSGAISFLQVDPDWAGGITEQRHICSLASAYDVPVIAHGHTLAPALHVAAAQPPQVVPMIEHLVRVQEWTQAFQRTVRRPVDGGFPLPTEPGLGIDLDPERIDVRETVRYVA
jgi:L-alanine-DL-glutamate epimerase-like enolase superfamily enzyme